VQWEWHDEEWWSRLSSECRDFISKLLVYNWHERMDVNNALQHPWLSLADKIYQEEYQISTDRLRNYYNLYRFLFLTGFYFLLRHTVNVSINSMSGCA
jgi:serine/threonine protein kinase